VNGEEVLDAYRPVARDVATVTSTRLPFVWDIRVDGWEQLWSAIGSRAHADAKARRVLRRLGKTRQSHEVRL
jgi:hypothetical protein